MLSLRPILAVLLGVLLAAGPSAQWGSSPYDPAKPLLSGRWFLAHDPGSGLQAFSAIAQAWTPIAPAGATVPYFGASAIVTDAGGGSLSGWSAFTNASSAQPIAPGYVSKVSSSSTSSFGAFFDPHAGGFGTLLAYSAYTSAWSSVALADGMSGTFAAGANVGLQRVGTKYYAYSAYSGAWVAFDAPTVVGFPIVGSDFVALDLNAGGASGPLFFAAFSAPRSVWTVSPVYPASGATPISGATALAIKADVGSPTSYRYAGYSAFTGEWTTSSLTHQTGALVTTKASENLVRVQDPDASARFEVFGSGNGVWQSLTGPNLTEDSLHDDFHVVRTATGSPATVYVASGLVGGGYTSISVPTVTPAVSTGSHGCVVYDAASVASTMAWGYSAATNAFQAPIPFSQVGGPLLVPGGGVFGFNLKGASSGGTHAQAFGVRWNQWIPGPVIDTAHTWATDGNGDTLALIRVEPTGFTYTVFDEHSNGWLPGPGLTKSYHFAPNGILAYTPATGDYWGYSAQRGDWTLQTGIGPLVCNGGFPHADDNLLWMCEGNKLWAFATPDRTQSWFQWPAAKSFGLSGATPGGSTPYVGLSVRGKPAGEYAIVYAGGALSPLTIPGLTGVADLAATGAFLFANLGIIDADGVLEARVAIPGDLPASTQGWLQMVTVDLASGQVGFAGRATGVRFF